MKTKPGLQSTEFLMMVLAGVVVVLSGTDKVSIDPGLLQTYIGAIIAYVIQRGYVKGKASDAVNALRAKLPPQNPPPSLGVTGGAP